LANSGSNGLELPKSPILNLLVKKKNWNIVTRKIKSVIDKERRIFK